MGHVLEQQHTGHERTPARAHPGETGPELVGAHSHGPAEPAGTVTGDGRRSTSSFRLRSADPDVFGVPHGREEDWRFTPVKRLASLLRGEAPSGPGVETAVAAADGVVVAFGADPRIGTAFVPADRLAAVALSRGASEAVNVTIPAGGIISEPTTISCRGSGGRAYGHVLIDAGPGSESMVVLEHSGTAEYAANVEVRVGDGARLTLVQLQEWDDDAVHGGAQAALLGRDATYRSIVVTLGGGVVRLTPTVEYAGPGGNAELLGLYFADSGQHLEHRSYVDHNMPDCRSRVTYKGALQSRPGAPDARTVWVGDVVIQKAATGTDTYEVNRNLVLTDGARADSVPNLEIETGEVVGAGHASATGRFDDEQLFYLQTRGIPQDVAKRLVVRGFFADLIARIGIESLVERLTAAVDRELLAVESVEPVGDSPSGAGAPSHSDVPDQVTAEEGAAA